MSGRRRGPGPLREVPGQRRRFSVRPGITCLWQVSGRSSMPFKKWMEFAVQYIDQWSLGLDLTILAKTLPTAMGGSLAG